MSPTELVSPSSAHLARIAGPEVRVGSFASVWACTDDFRSTPKNRHRHSPSACLKSAMAQSRCAPARCAGARAERLVADGEDSDSRVASINWRIVGVQRMIKNNRII